MGRHRASANGFIGAAPPYPCFFGCGRDLCDKYTREAERWTWFSGYGATPVHFCPWCQKARHDEIEMIRANLNKRPAAYPKEFASPYPSAVKTWNGKSACK